MCNRHTKGRSALRCGKRCAVRQCHRAIGPKKLGFARASEIRASPAEGLTRARHPGPAYSCGKSRGEGSGASWIHVKKRPVSNHTDYIKMRPHCNVRPPALVPKTL